MRRPSNSPQTQENPTNIESDMSKLLAIVATVSALAGCATTKSNDPMPVPADMPETFDKPTHPVHNKEVPAAQPARSTEQIRHALTELEAEITTLKKDIKELEAQKRKGEWTAGDAAMLNIYHKELQRKQDLNRALEKNLALSERLDKLEGTTDSESIFPDATDEELLD